MIKPQNDKCKKMEMMSQKFSKIAKFISFIRLNVLNDKRPAILV